MAELCLAERLLAACTLPPSPGAVGLLEPHGTVTSTAFGNPARWRASLLAMQPPPRLDHALATESEPAL